MRLSPATVCACLNHLYVPNLDLLRSNETAALGFLAKYMSLISGTLVHYFTYHGRSYQVLTYGDKGSYLL